MYDPKIGAYTKQLDSNTTVYQLMDTEDRMTCSLRQVKEIVGHLLMNPKVSYTPDDFNAHERLINTVDGVLDLATMTLQPHSPDLRFTYAVDAQFKPTSRLNCPEFEQFCETFLEGDSIKRQFLLEVIGFCLSDIPPAKAKCAFFLKGEPNSGKSILCEWLSRLIDENQISNLLLHELGSRFNRIELLGKKMNICSEIKGSAISDITHFKMVTGGDRIDGELKNNPVHVYFKTRCKLIFAGNTLPQTTESDITRAFANRMAVLLSNQSIPPDAQDPLLLDKLYAERDQIFTLAMYALAELRQRNYHFQMPSESTEYVQAYIRLSNSVRLFIDDCYILGPDARIHNKPLYDAYLVYCTDNCIESVKKGVSTITWTVSPK